MKSYVTLELDFGDGVSNATAKAKLMIEGVYAAATAQFESDGGLPIHRRGGFNPPGHWETYVPGRGWVYDAWLERKKGEES